MTIRLAHCCRWIGLLALLAAVWAPRPAVGQVEFSNIPPAESPVFDLDWAAFRSGKDSLRLECYYKITNPRLSYVRRAVPSSDASQIAASADTSAERYVAAYEIVAILDSERDPQAASVSARENYVLPTFEETRNPSGFLVNVLTMNVSAADYELAVTLTDRVSGNSYTGRRTLPLRDWRGDKFTVGGPMFFDPSAVAPEAPQFQRHGMGLVPSVSRAFAATKDRVAMFLEVYRDIAPDAAYLRVEAAQRFGKLKQVDSVGIPAGSIAPVTYKSPLAGFTTGEATLQVTAVNASGHSLGRTLEIPFWVDWTMAGMVDENWKDAVDMLVHIATHDELKDLRSAPEPERTAAFAEFWKSKDPTPQSDDNPWQDEYYRRIRHADLHFTTAFMRGWRTDYGTVYVRYGEPDEIERHPFERESRPYQIWFYYAQRRRFVFVDMNGNGEYELQYPYDGLIR